MNRREFCREEEAPFSGADRVGIEGSGDRHAGGAPDSYGWDFGADVLPLEEGLRRTGIRPGKEAEAPAGREREVEVLGGESVARQDPALQDVLKKVVSTLGRRDMTRYLETRCAVSERRARAVAACMCSTYRYRSRRNPRMELHARIREIAHARVHVGGNSQSIRYQVAVTLNSTNPLERVNDDVKRRANVVGIFPNEGATVRLVGASPLEQNDEWVIQRRYMNLEMLAGMSDNRRLRLPAMAA